MVDSSLLAVAVKAAGGEQLQMDPPASAKQGSSCNTKQLQQHQKAAPGPARAGLWLLVSLQSKLQQVVVCAKEQQE